MLVYLNIDGSINQMHKEEAVDKLLAQYDSVSSLYEFHPDMFEDLSKAEMQLLAELFYSFLWKVLHAKTPINFIY